LNRLRKNSISGLILGGAALQRCGNCFVLSPALAAEVALSGRERLFPQPLEAVPLRPARNVGFSP